MRTVRIDESQLIADLRKNGQTYLAFTLGDTVRRLNRKEGSTLTARTASQLNKCADELEQLEADELEPSKIDAIHALGTKLKEFVEVHTPRSS